MDISSQALMSSASLAIAAVILCVAVASGVWMLIRLSGLKLAPVALLLVGFLSEAILRNQLYVDVGLQLYPLDAISVFALMAFFIGFMRRPLPIGDPPFLQWLGLGALIFISLFIGLVEYGKAAGTEARPFIYLWVAGLYCYAAKFTDADLKQMGRWCQWTAYACLAIAAYIWLGTEIGLLDYKEVEEFAAPGGVFRPVSSHVAFYVAAVALVQTIAWLRGTGSRLSGLHAAVFWLFVVIIQHRSVWAAAIGALPFVLILERRHLPRRFPLLLGFILGGALAASFAAAFGYLDEVERSLVQSVLTISLTEGTLAGRIDGWVRLIEPWADSSFSTVLLGYPFGRGYARLANNEIIGFGPHNFYVDLVLRVGVLGLVLFMLPTLAAIVRGWRMKCASEFDYLLTRGVAVSLIASLFYAMAYPTFYLCTAAAGILSAHIMRSQQRRREPIAGSVGSLQGPRAGPALK